MNYISRSKNGILVLSGNHIHDEGAIAIAKALKTNTTLHTLNLNRNNISNEGSIVIAKALETNTTLHTLHLCGNDIYNEGAIAIAKALKINTTLHTLDLYYNNICDKGASSIENIEKALERNKVLKRMKEMVYKTYLGFGKIHTSKLPHNVRMMLCFQDELSDMENTKYSDHFLQQLQKSIICKN